MWALTIGLVSSNRLSRFMGRQTSHQACSRVKILLAKAVLYLATSGIRRCQKSTTSWVVLSISSVVKSRRKIYSGSRIYLSLERYNQNFSSKNTSLWGFLMNTWWNLLLRRETFRGEHWGQKCFLAPLVWLETPATLTRQKFWWMTLPLQLFLIFASQMVFKFQKLLTSSLGCPSRSNQRNFKTTSTKWYTNRGMLDKICSTSLQKLPIPLKWTKVRKSTAIATWLD